MRDVARDLSCRAGIHPGLGLQSRLMKNAQNRPVTVAALLRDPASLKYADHQNNQSHEEQKMN